MNKEDLILKLFYIKNHIHDKEVAHVKADNLLLEYINDPEITEAFENIDKWYA